MALKAGNYDMEPLSKSEMVVESEAKIKVVSGDHDTASHFSALNLVSLTIPPNDTDSSKTMDPHKNDPEKVSEEVNVVDLVLSALVREEREVVSHDIHRPTFAPHELNHHV